MNPAPLAYQTLAPSVAEPEAQPGAGAPPVFILHGLFGSGANWRTVGRSLAAHRAVHLVDARNHGRSPHREGMSYLTQADDVLGLLDRMEIDQATLIGHSMGGKTAMCLALTHPSRVARLVVLDIAPVTYNLESDSDPSGHRALIRYMRALSDSERTNRRSADQALAPAVPDPILRAFLLHNLARDPDRPDGPLSWRIDLDALDAGLAELRQFPFNHAGRAEARTRTYPGPALFLAGSQSNYIARNHLPRIKALFPSATITTVADAGHWLHAEQPATVTACIENFLAEADPT